MKNHCPIHARLIILLMLVNQFTSAQDYFVTSKGDTLFGEVKPLLFGPEKKVQVITEDSKKNTFTIFQTRAFNYKGDIYQPVRNEKGYVFMKLAKPGYLSLYSFQMENQVSYDGLYLLKKDGSGMEIPNLAFKKLMTRFLADCEAVTTRIDNGELNKRSIEQIVDEYNSCIDSRTIDHTKAIAQNEVAAKKTSAWEDLEDKVKNKPDFEGKNDAIEMIGDIINKIKRGEKVPNFLLEGLKNSLSAADLNTELQSALEELKN